MQKTRARAALVLFSIWLAAAAASRVDAASLYKCAGVDGSVSYQSQPCEPGAEQVWERALTAEARSAPAPRGGSVGAAGPVASAPARPLVRSAGAAPKASPPRKSASPACQRAHAADAAYRAQPLSRVKHDGLRRHGDRIRAACGSG